MSAEPTASKNPNIQPVDYAGGPEMTLLDHLKELRNRALVCAVAVVLGTLVSLVFWEVILGWLLAPAREEIPGFRLRYNSPTEVIGIIFKIGLYGGMMIASPVLVYELLAFIVPGLTPRERRMIFPGLIGVVIFLLGGMAFAYYIILPRSLGFLLNLGNEDLEPLITAGPYMSFATRIIFGVGIAFEVPMVLAMAARLGVVSARQLLRFWRYAIIVIFVISAIITPTPDPYNQTLVAGPLFILYFVGILMAWIVGRPRPRPAVVQG